MTPPYVIDVLLALQAFHVAFLALHDWVPLGPLNDIAAQRGFKPLQVRLAGTLISTAPFLFGFVASLSHWRGFPHWLVIYLLVAYAFLFTGEIESWWATYFFGYRAARAGVYSDLYSKTHGFLPPRHGIVPNTLHVILHSATLLTLLLLIAALIGALGRT
jgi:hypothetical protein